MIRGSPVFVQVFIVLFIVGQTAITIAESAAFGSSGYLWRMFATKVQPTQVRLIGADGNATPLDWSRHVAYSRKGIDFLSLLPPHLCRIYPDAASIELKRLPSEFRTVPCSR